MPRADTGAARFAWKFMSTTAEQLRGTKNPAIGFSAGTAIIMTIVRMRFASKSRWARTAGAVQTRRRKNLTLARESALMVDKVDIASDAVAIRFVSGYDKLWLA